MFVEEPIPKSLQSQRRDGLFVKESIPKFLPSIGMAKYLYPL
jgi:hypothetical protein